jgi:hypothetical protein
MSADTERLTTVIGRRMRAMAARFRRPAQPHPEFYGIPVRHVDSAGVEKERPSKSDVSSEHAQAMQAYLPIGPSCC